MSRRISSQLRALVERRAAGCCEYCRCQAQFAMQAFSIEHIHPVGAGGNSTPDNLALACQGCNNHKYNKTHALDLVTGERVALFNPRRQVWSEHFAWSDDCCLVVGISPVGRATVEALRLNRAGVVNLRRVLVGAGYHPPD